MEREGKEVKGEHPWNKVFVNLARPLPWALLLDPAGWFTLPSPPASSLHQLYPAPLDRCKEYNDKRQRRSYSTTL